MDREFWAARWSEGRIGFHEGHANAFLEKHLALLSGGGEKPRRVLVPLCGKAEDMTFLASRGHEVVGIEVIEDAVKAFFVEHSLSPEVRSENPSKNENGNVRSYRAGGITIFAGDVFACTKELVGKVDALYDRAALVALPPDVRPRYVAHLRALLEPGSRALVVTFDYAQELMAGPPFSVNEDEVRRSFAGATRIEEVDSGPTTAPRFAESGVPAIERCFSITLPTTD